ncbi:MAG TPA: S41 family peptidase [Sphingobacteriaceae bacterium]
MIINLRKYALHLALAGVVVFASCKKEPSPEPVNTDPPVTNPSGTRMQLTLDSIYLYAKEVYYWNDAIPAQDVFNPRQYTTRSGDLNNFNAELFAITQLKINPETGKAYEYVEGENGMNAGYPKYSYIRDKADENPTSATASRSVSSVDLEGNGNDLGLALSAIGTNSNFEVRIRYSSPGSPAEKAGLGRGDLINTFEGRTVGTDFQNEVGFINNAMAGSTVKLAGRKKDGSAFNVTLTKAVYKSSPIYKDTILTSGSKKIGYLAYARFSNTTNSDAALKKTFADFAAGGVTDLIIDLRYNGGGYVHIAELLSNLIAPSSLNGKVMFREKFNSTMQSGKATILKNQPLLDANDKPQYEGGELVTYFDIDYSEENNVHHFEKKGTLDGIQNVVFIVTGSTASASELVINNLKPHMNVKVVGKQSYGKPIGFFPITIQNKYDVYYSMFTSINSAGETDYYAGFVPDVDVADDVTRDFGDPAELSLAAAIRQIPGTSTTIAATRALSSLKIKGQTVSSSAVKTRDVTPETDFTGMIESRFKRKKK